MKYHQGIEELLKELRLKDEEANALRTENEVLKRQILNEPTHSSLDVDSLVNFMTDHELHPFIATSQGLPMVRPLCHSFGGYDQYQFQFQEQNRNFGTVHDGLINILNKLRLSGCLDKRSFKIPLFHAAPGTGKSRSLDELAHRVDEWLEKIASTKHLQLVSIPYTVSFGNGTVYVPYFSGNNCETSKSNPSLGSCARVCPHIAMRMLHSHIRDVQFRTFTEKFVDSFGEHGFFKMDLEIVLKSMERLYVRQLEQHLSKDGISLPVERDDLLFVHTVLLDEYNKNILEKWSSMEGFVNQVLKTMGNGIMELSSIKEQRVLWCAIAGTEGVPLQRAASNSSFTVKEIRFSPLLTEDEVASIIDDLVTRTGDVTPTNLRDWRRWAEFRAALRKVAGHPRVLESFIEEIFKFSRQTAIPPRELNQALSNACESIMIYLDRDITELAFRSTMFGGEFDQSTQDKLQKYSLITVKNDVPSIPFALLNRVANCMGSTNFDFLTKLASDPLITSRMYGLAWEDFCQRILAFRMAACILAHHSDKITLGKLFHKALMNDSTAGIEVDLDKRDIRIANADSNALQSKVSAAALEHLEKVVSGSIWRNAAGASAGDLLWRMQRLLIQVQCKFAEKDRSTWDYNSLIQDEHVKKNEALVKAWNDRHPNDPLHGVTVFMVGAPVKGIPEKIMDRVIIIHTENLEEFLGPFAHLRTLVAAQGIIRVNELSAEGLGRAFSSAFGQGKPILAEAIVELRDGENGRSFRDIDDLVDRVNEYGWTIESDGKRRLHFVENYVEKLLEAGEKGYILF